MVLLPCLISNSKEARGGASLTDALRASKGKRSKEVFVLPLQDAWSVRWSVHYQNSTPFSPNDNGTRPKKIRSASFFEAVPKRKECTESKASAEILKVEDVAGGLKNLQHPQTPAEAIEDDLIYWNDPKSKKNRDVCRVP